MSELKIQKGKLIGQNGPGSLYIDTKGINYIISAADKWYNPNLLNTEIYLKDLELHDDRLKKTLSVEKFLSVPDYRKPIKGKDNKNTGLVIPVQKFPLVQYCPFCGQIGESIPNKDSNFDRCSKCEKRIEFIQFPIVIACEEGHIDDFPYFEYTHVFKEAEENQEHNIKLNRYGSSILDWALECSCGAKHSLMGVTGQSEKGEQSPFQKEMRGVHCSGSKPWTGDASDKDKCINSPVALLKNSVNVYRPELLKYLSITTGKKELTGLEDIYFEEFSKLSGEDIEEDSDKLKVRTSFEREDKIIKKVCFVDRLQEMVVQTSFQRLSPIDETSVFNKASSKSNKSMIFSKEIGDKINWYPAKIMYGEGIFIEFNSELLLNWEETENLENYYKKMNERTNNFYLQQQFQTATSIMIHTLSHLLIKELSKHCGYPMASLSEKIYSDQENERFGLLIYVTDSDKAGTYGGLSRLANSESFQRILNLALRSAQWCSSDPICREFGNSTGQGLNNSNGSACHNCTYIPDTACQSRNCFLDRELLISNEDSVSVSDGYSWF